MDESTQKQVRDLTAKGFAGTVFLTTENCQASYEEMKARGVEFTEEPHQMPYGIDSGFRDPSGNSVRLTQLADIGANTGEGKPSSAALGSAAFFVVAPGTFVGLGPWLITHWEIPESSPPLRLVLGVGVRSSSA